MTDFKLHCYTGPWGAENLIQAITEIAECGFGGIECPADVVQRYEDRLHVFEEILQCAGMRLGGLLQAVNLLDRDHADEQVEHAANSARFAKAAGMGILTLCHHGVQTTPMTNEEWATLGAIVEEIGDRCREFQVRLCFLPRAERLVGTEREIKRLLASTHPDLVKLAVDTAEIALAGGNPQRVIKAHSKRIGSVRFRDVSASKRRAKTTSNKSGSTPQFGRGAVKFDAVSKVLLNENYEGPIILDVSGEAHTPLEAIRSAHRFLERHSGLFAP